MHGATTAERLRHPHAQSCRLQAMWSDILGENSSMGEHLSGEAHGFTFFLLANVLKFSQGNQRYPPLRNTPFLPQSNGELSPQLVYSLISMNDPAAVFRPTRQGLVRLPALHNVS